MSVQQACNSEFPKFSESVDHARTVLVAWTPKPDSGRQLASVPAMAWVDRESWQKWAEERLVETEHYRDLFEDDDRLRGARHEISDVSNDLVEFHGFTSQGRLDKMIVILSRIQARAGKIREVACESPSK